MLSVRRKLAVDRLLNIQQFAELLGVTPSCIRRWILERRITVIKVGRLVRIPLSELERVTLEGLREALNGRRIGPPSPRNKGSEVPR
jgi:excisionase family DNA binding protein